MCGLFFPNCKLTRIWSRTDAQHTRPGPGVLGGPPGKKVVKRKTTQVNHEENKPHNHKLKKQNCWKTFGASFGTFWASPGPGVAGHGFSAENDSQFRGRHSNPCPGNPFRGHLSFLNVTPQHMANVYVYVCCFFPSKSFSTT